MSGSDEENKLPVKNVLVIGGSYFVGRVFVEELSKVPGYAIYVMNRGNVPLNIEGVTEIKCDRHDTEAMSEAIPSIVWNAVVDFCAYTPEDITTMISTLPCRCHRSYVFINRPSCRLTKTDECRIGEQASSTAGPQPGPLTVIMPIINIWLKKELKIQCSENSIPWTILKPTFIYGKYNYAPREGYFFESWLRKEKRSSFRTMNLRFSRLYPYGMWLVRLLYVSGTIMPLRRRSICIRGRTDFLSRFIEVLG